MKFVNCALLSIAAVIAFSLSNNIKRPNGLYFFDKGNVSLINARFTLNYNLSLNDFIIQSEYLKECRLKINELCEKMDDPNVKTNCNYFRKFISSNEKSLNFEFNRIVSKLKRSKRFLTVVALLYVWIKKWLSNDGVNQEIIDELQTIDQQNRDFIKNHISLTNNTLNVHKRAFHKIIHSINTLQNEIFRINEEKSVNLLKYNISNLIQFATLIMLKHYQLMNTLNKILLKDVDANLLSIIDEETLLADLQNVAKKLGENQMFPIKDLKLNDILQISETSVAISGGNILISLKIPIISEDTYSHHEIIRIPHKNNNKMFIFRDIAENILINGKNNEHILLRNEELNKCKIINDKWKICSIEAAIFKGSSCESDALISQNTKTCPFKEIPDKTYFMRFSETSFLIIPFNITQILVSCPGSASIVYIIDSDFQININPGCTIQNDEFKYQVENEYSENITLALANDSTGTVSFENITNYIPEIKNNTLMISDFDPEFQNITEQLIRLYVATSQKPNKIEVSTNEVGLMVLLITAIIFFIIIRVGFIICQKTIK